MRALIVKILCFAFAASATAASAGDGAGPHPVTLLAPRAGHRSNAFGTPYSSGLWPKFNGVATVFYVIDPASDPNAGPKITAALNQFNADFPGIVQWAAWNSPQTQGPNYVDINLSASDTSGQCEALEGYEAIPAQRMWGSTNCTVGTILHEMGHVIGLWHEQSRPDSATYISINYANVVKGSWGNFQAPADNFQLLTPYDYASVMQYPSFAFTRNGAPVIESIPAGIPLGGSDGVPYPVNADYSAGDKEGIERLYGAAPTSVTVTSNPLNLKVTVDGSTFLTPQSFAWPLNSTHTLSVPAGVQTLSGQIANSPTKATFYYTYGRWNDSPKQAHTITVKPGNGDVTFPRLSPQVATYAANFVQLVPYHAAISPAKSGQVSVAPLPKNYPGASGKFFVARQPVTLTAAPAASWEFYEFNNAPYWLPGGLGANPKSFYVPDTGNPIATTVMFSNAPIYSVRLTPDYPTSNLFVSIDSGGAYTPKNFSPKYDSGWIPGSTHTLSFDSPAAPYSLNTRFAFVGWGTASSLAPSSRLAEHSRVGAPINGGLRPTAARMGPLLVRHRSNGLRADTLYSTSITLPASSAAYVGTIAPQYAPATNFGYPPCGGSGTLTPGSPTGDGFYPSGAQLNFSASPGIGWVFAGWSDDAAGMGNPATLTATDETLVFANFNITPTPLTVTGLTPASAVAGSPASTLRIKGTGFSPASLVAFNGSYRQVKYIGSTQLSIPVTAADLATPGAFQVFVENFPPGSSGCAVFGYWPFFVASM